MREKAEGALTELNNCQNGMFRLIKGLKTDSKVVEGRCLGGTDGKLCFSVKEGGKVWEDYIKRIMNGENIKDHSVKVDPVECPAVCASGEEVVNVLNEMKT